MKQARALLIAGFTLASSLAPVASAQTADLVVVQGDNINGTLTVSPSSFVVGAAITVSGWTITNRGSLASSGTWRIGFYLSTDPVITPADQLVRQIVVTSALVPGGSFSSQAATVLTVPVAAPGPFYLGILADNRNNTAEGDETNNYAAAPVQLLPGPPDNTPITRLQLRLVTGTVTHAQTDNAVLVELNGSNQTFLDYPRNDFERGDDFPYDLLLNGVTTFGNIQRLRISKASGDGWCLRRADLIVNGAAIFSRDFGSPCRWLDDASGGSLSVEFDYTQLRRSTTWQNYAVPGLALPIVMSRSELESRIAGAVGHAINGQPAYWGYLHGRGVEVTRKADNRLSVDLDLALDIPGPNPEADVDFELTVACSCGIISMTVGNVKANVSRAWLYDIITGARLESSIERGMRGISQTIGTGSNQVFCPTILVDAGGNLRLGMPALGPDLVSVPGGVPELVRPGDVLPVRVTVRNVGNLPAGGFNTSLYFGTSVAPQLGTLLDNTPVIQLPACAVQSWTRTVTIPANTPCGTYIIGTSCDNAQVVAETDERNNTFPVRVRVGLPELAIISNLELFTSNFFGMPGGPAGWPITLGAAMIRNEGAFASVPVSYGVYLSTDQTITSTDIRIGGGAIPALDPREEYVWPSNAMTIPATMPPGRYYLAVLLDENLAMNECNRTNNVRWFDFVVNP